MLLALDSDRLAMEQQYAHSVVVLCGHFAFDMHEYSYIFIYMYNTERERERASEREKAREREGERGREGEKERRKAPGKGDEDNEKENAKVDDIIDSLDDCTDQNANARMCSRGLQYLDEVQDHDRKTCPDQ